MSELDRTLSFTTRNRTLVLNIPYAETENAEWSHENIKVKVDIPSLLEIILPTGCLQDNECCAVKYVKQDEVRKREAEARTVLGLPMAEKQPASVQDEWDRMCCGAGEGWF